MKKQSKRLVLNRETIVRLTTHHLAAARGGEVVAPTNGELCKTVHGVSCDDCLAGG